MGNKIQNPSSGTRRPLGTAYLGCFTTPIFGPPWLSLGPFLPIRRGFTGTCPTHKQCQLFLFLFLHCFSTKQSDDQRKNSQLGLLKAQIECLQKKKLGKFK